MHEESRSLEDFIPAPNSVAQCSPRKCAPTHVAVLFSQRKKLTGLYLSSRPLKIKNTNAKGPGIFTICDNW